MGSIHWVWGSGSSDVRLGCQCLYFVMVSSNLTRGIPLLQPPLLTKKLRSWTSFKFKISSLEEEKCKHLQELH